jgi:hypothetical protein
VIKNERQILIEPTDLVAIRMRSATEVIDVCGHLVDVHVPKLDIHINDRVFEWISGDLKSVANVALEGEEWQVSYLECPA